MPRLMHRTQNFCKLINLAKYKKQNYLKKCKRPCFGTHTEASIMWKRQLVCASFLGGAMVPLSNPTTSKWLTQPVFQEEPIKTSSLPEKVSACVVGGGLSGISIKTIFFLNDPEKD